MTFSLLRVVLSLLLLLATARAEEAPDRALLALDKVLSGPLVQGMNVTVHYTVHNVGARPASAIVLRDSSFPASRFHTDRVPRSNWPSLSPGESVELSVRVAPRRAGELYVAPAAVSYMDGEDKRTMRVAGTESVVVEELLAYRRKTETHESAWMVFLGAFIVLAVAPFGVSSAISRSLPNPTTVKKQ